MTDRQTDMKTDRQSGRQKSRQIVWQTDRGITEADRQAGGHKGQNSKTNRRDGQDRQERITNS
jgi:hypothetical protein